MDQAINTGGVRTVSIHNTAAENMHVVSVYIHHELTPEREQELATLLEGLIARAITTWVKL